MPNTVAPCRAEHRTGAGITPELTSIFVTQSIAASATGGDCTIVQPLAYPQESSDCFAALGALFNSVDTELERLTRLGALQAGAALMRAQTRAHLRTLMLAYTDQLVDRSVGTDEVEDQDDEPSAACPSAPLTSTGSWTVELTPAEYARKTVDVSHDLASLLCAVSMATLAVRLRWLSIATCALGAAGPVLVVFAHHWATGGVGQFALAFQWPLWLEVWYCVGSWLFVCALLLWYGSMQRDLAWMALRQFSTLWVIIMTGVFVAGWIHLSEFGVHRSTWVVLPCYIVCVLLFPLVAMADALPPMLRLRVLRFGGPFAFGAVGAMALVLRLPTAENTPGELVWTVMGIETVTNLQAITYSTTVLAVLLAKGALRAWLRPNDLAFIHVPMQMAEQKAGVAAELAGGGRLEA